MVKESGLYSLQTFVYSENKNHTLTIKSNNNENIHHTHCCQKCRVVVGKLGNSNQVNELRPTQILK